jgi:TM2 domain-containing membrane protein YozV/type II secretory pathway pseudopilin PulG
MPETIVSTKYCSTCGKPLHARAEICPNCGVRATTNTNEGVNKVALLLITFFLGGIGAHKFYVKKYGLGILYLLFFWTGIPGLVAFVEFISYCVKSETELQQRYPQTNWVALILAAALSLAAIAMIGIIAAIAIPQFASYRQKAHNATALSDLKSCRTETEAYYADNFTYPTQTGQMVCGAATGVAVYYLSLGGDDFQIIAFHQNGDTAYLTGSDNTEISQNSRTEIEDQIAEQLGMEGGYGFFHFME